MYAAVMHDFGGPEVIGWEMVPTPRPGPHDVLVQVHAVTINRTLDIKVRQGAYAKRPVLPHVLGVDPSGVVVETGAEVSDFKPGDPVAVSSRIRYEPEDVPRMLGVDLWGGYAEYVCVPAASAFPLPAGLDFATASIAIRHVPQAFHMLETKAKLQPGEWVLVMGASGGLGSASVQVARHLGARVIVAAGADERVSAAMALGGEFGINYRSQDLHAEVMRITGNAGVDVVCENISDPVLFPAAFKSLRRFGRLVSVGTHGGGIVPLDVAFLYLNQLTIMGSTGQTPDDIRKGIELAASGKFRPLIGCVLPLYQVREGHVLADGNDVLGKVVLDPRARPNGAAQSLRS